MIKRPNDRDIIEAFYDKAFGNIQYDKESDHVLSSVKDQFVGIDRDGSPEITITLKDKRRFVITIAKDLRR